MKKKMTLKYVMVAICGPLFWPALSAYSLAQSKTSAPSGWDNDGRLVVENKKITAVFDREDGTLLVYMKSQSGNKGSMRIAPFSSQDRKADKIVSCKILESGGGRSAVEVSFSAGRMEIRASLFFGEDGAIEIKPVKNLKGISIVSAMEYVVVPSRIMDDLIYDPKKFPAESELYLPSEQMFMGLLEGGDGILVCTWPGGSQKMKLLLEPGKTQDGMFKSFDIELDDKSAWFGILAAPGIWHAEELLPSYLEKDVGIEWERPFAAKWKTHLVEDGGVETAYSFRDKKETSWRAGLGTILYPVWFQDERAFFHLSKKFPPVGQVLIYPLEGHKNTPLEFATRCIGDISSLRTRKGLQRPEPVTGMAPCDGHDYMTRVFRMGLQTREKQFLWETLDDFMALTSVHAKRLLQYHNFIERMNAKLEAWRERGTPELRSFLDKMKCDLEKVSEEHSQRMGDMTAPELLRYQTEGIETLKALVEEEGLEVYPEAAFLIEENHLSVSLTEGVAVGVGGQVREWARQAAYRCAHNAAAVKYAEEIRKKIREHLGNGSSYESVY